MQYFIRNVNVVIVEDNSMVLKENLKDDCYIITSNKNLGVTGGSNLSIRFALEKMRIILSCLITI